MTTYYPKAALSLQKMTDDGFALYWTEHAAHMVEYADAGRTCGVPYWARPKKVYSDACVNAFYEELKAQASTGRNPRVFSGFSWRQLNAIAGRYAFEVFDVLRARGMLKSRVIPNAYGHEEYELVA